MGLTSLWGLFFLLSFAIPSAQSKALEDIEYARAGGFSLRMDAWMPDGPGPFPAAILVHGGGWVKGDRRGDVQPLFQPLEHAGIAWFSISYRLAKGSGEQIASALLAGQAVDDVKHAISFIKAHAGEYNIDPNRIALIGESAGAQLAAMAALKPGSAGPVRAVVAFYGPFDLADLARKYVNGTDSNLVNMIFQGLGTYSPINLVTSDAPPFLLIHGTADTLVPFSQSEQMYARLQAAHVPSELYPVKGAGHGIRWWESAHVTAYKQHMIDWLTDELKPR